MDEIRPVRFGQVFAFSIIDGEHLGFNLRARSELIYAQMSGMKARSSRKRKYLLADNTVRIPDVLLCFLKIVDIADNQRPGRLSDINAAKSAREPAV